VFAYGAPVDLRKGFNGLSALVEQEMKHKLLEGDVYLFLGRKPRRAKVLYFDGTGLCLLANQLASHCTSLDRYHTSLSLGCLDCSRSIDEAIPTTALLDWRIPPWRLMEVGVTVIGMSRDDFVFSPADEGLHVDSETGRSLILGEHASLPKSVVARAQSIAVDEICHPYRGETRIARA
jgi:transposase